MAFPAACYPHGCQQSAPFVGVLDGYTAGLKVAWSIKKRLLSSYTGFAALVRADRTGQPTYQIPFLANGDWDTAGLLSFAGSDSVYVVGVYAQIGSIDIEQSVALLQPRIVDAGVLDSNGVYFGGVQSLHSGYIDASAFTGGSGTTLQVITELVVPTGGGGNSFGWGNNFVGDYVNQYSGFYSDLPEFYARVVGAQVSTDARHVISRERSGASADLRVDGSVTASRVDASGAITGTNTFQIGKGAGRYFYTGNIATFCIWDNTTDAAGRAAVLA